MLLRHLQNFDAPSAQADVCIIGSGAAGLTIALELAGSPLRVIVLEGGERGPDQASQALYHADVVGLPHKGISDRRFRVFGGSTTRWAGQALPLFDIDFEHRDWVAHSGWPLSRDALEPYYRRASDVLSVPRFARHPMDEWPNAVLRPVGFDPHLIDSFLSTYSPILDFAKAYGPRLSAAQNVEIILGANVTEVVPDPAVSYIQSVRVQSLSGKKLEVRAQFFVLCCGGIESVRILLASNRHCEAGLGNNRDLVGRFFQDHPGVVVGALREPVHPELGAHFRCQRVSGVQYGASRFRSADEFQRKQELLHCYGEILLDFDPSVEAARRIFTALRRRAWAFDLKSDLRAVASNPLPALRAAARRATGHGREIRGAEMYLAVGCEQAPNPRSRLYLTDERDALGMRRLALDWQMTQAEIVSVRRFAEAAASELNRLGLGEVDLEAFKLPEHPAQLAGVFWDAGHHMGAIRMGLTPADGVVDASCRLFGLENLYVGSTAVFPTSGFSNPTLTLIALCIRIADTIRQRTSTSGEARGSRFSTADRTEGQSILSRISANGP